MTLEHLISLFLLYKYPIILVVTIFEGPVIMMLSGVMYKLGFVEFFPVFVSLMIGDLIGDTFYYFLGYYFADPVTKKWGKFVGVTPELLQKTHDVFINHQAKILFLSKITMGFGFSMATMITAGMTKVPFRKYISINAAGQIVWTGFLMTTGYFFGNLVSKINNDLRYVALCAFIIIILFVMRGIQSYLRLKNIKNKN